MFYDKNVKQLLVIILILLVAPISAWAQDYAPQKVVYHVNYGEVSRINATFGNINNHIEALGEDSIDVKVVVHGPALTYFIEAKTSLEKQVALDVLRFQDVQFLICGNTLRAYKLTHEALYDVEEEDIVQAGLPAIVALQQAGYIYLRP